VTDETPAPDDLQIRDINARVEVEDALRVSEERYRAFIANSSEGIWRFELDEPVPTDLTADEQIERFYKDGHLAECNDAMARMYGYERAEEIVGARLGDLLVRTDPANLEYLRAFIASGYRLTDVESVERDREGNLKLFANNLVGVVEGGNITRGWGTQRDVTDRRLAENAMRVSEERLRRAQQAAHLGTWDWDLKSGEIVWSEGMYELLGIEPVGSGPNIERWLEVVLPEDAAQTEKLMQDVLARGGEFATEFRVRRADGELRWLASIGRVEVGEDGVACRALGVNIDVTERKRTEEERELFLAREQAARMQAEEANRLKDEFLATLSHELRTPLTAILGWAHMLKAGGLDEATARHAVETVERNAHAQRQLIEDVLDVSRIVTGKLRIEQTAVNLLDVVRAALDSVRPAADAKRIELQCSFDPRAGLVAGDPTRLQQVVWNLLSNAVKFTPAGGVVRIGVERLLAQTRITLSDTGQGIAPDFLPYVFDRFRQADGSTTRQHGGLGLGLAIVRHLVEAHGGSVHAYSAGTGAGATFTVDLPPLPGEPNALAESRVLRSAVHAGDARPAVPGEEEEGDDIAPPLVGLRVLVVDDDEDAMEMLAAFLGRSGAEVSKAASASGALKEMSGREFDVIVSDIAMPVEDGYDFIRKVRASGDARGGLTPAVALTAYAGDGDRAQALRAGFQRHLAKPVEPRELLKVIADLAGKARST
jgi:PAS domain S-box-containing protein